jgi:hypothetical protein
MADNDALLQSITEMQCEPCLPVANNARVKVMRVMDGDTIVVGFWRSDCPDYPLKMSLRLLGFDAAEIHSKDLAEKQMGFVAKNRLADAVLNKIVTLRNVSVEKYGRVLADLQTDTIPSVCKFMLQDTETCKPYTGGTKASWHFSEERLALAPPIPPPQKRALSPKRSPHPLMATKVVTKTQTVTTSVVLSP